MSPVLNQVNALAIGAQAASGAYLAGSQVWGSKAVTVASSGSALAAAVPSPVDGQAAVIRLPGGSGQPGDVFDVPLIYNATRGRWVEPGDGLCAVRMCEQVRFQAAGGPNNIDVKQYVPMSNNPNGWGFVSARNYGAALAAGLSIEYRHHSMLRAVGGFGSYAGCCFYLYDPGDTANTAYTNPPTGHWAETDYLYSGTTNPGTGFYSWREAGWATLQGEILGGNTSATAGTHDPLAADSKHALYPAVYTRMDTGANAAAQNGGLINYALYLRFVL